MYIIKNHNTRDAPLPCSTNLLKFTIHFTYMFVIFQNENLHVLYSRRNLWSNVYSDLAQYYHLTKYYNARKKSWTFSILPEQISLLTVSFITPYINWYAPLPCKTQRVPVSCIVGMFMNIYCVTVGARKVEQFRVLGLCKNEDHARPDCGNIT